MYRYIICYLLFRCGKYNDARSYLNDTLNEIFSSYDVKFTLGDKLQILLAPPCDDNITKSQNHILKEALFEFLDSIDRKV